MSPTERNEYSISRSIGGDQNLLQWTPEREYCFFAGRPLAADEFAAAAREDGRAVGSIIAGGQEAITESLAVSFAGLAAPGEFQFNVMVPSKTPDGDQPITAAYNGATTQPGTLITVQHW